MGWLTLPELCDSLRMIPHEEKLRIHRISVVIRTFFTAVLVTTLVSGSCFAQSAKEAMVNAVQYRPIPAGAVIEIQVRDNSDGNLVLLALLSQAMQSKGYPLAETGTLVLTIETRDEIGAWSTSGNGNVIEFQTTQGSGRTDDSELRINLFDSNSNSLLSNSQSSPTVIVTPTRYVVNATLDSREEGKRLWEGWITSELGQSDGQKLTERMIPVLADTFGTSVSRKVVVLP